ncbi:MAG: patatin-like phospholipase family protein [Gammaproteobacteria bacterium]
MRGMGGVVLCCALVLALPGLVAGSAPESAARPKVALVLSGGGARGLAHVGVVKGLERLRIPYDCIAGTSMGAIAGGAFATGMSVADAERMVEEADWAAIFSDKSRRSDIPYFRKSEDFRNYFDFTLTLKGMDLLPPRNFVGVQNIGLFFRELTDSVYARHFDDLPIPFRAIGTDIGTGEAVVLNEGMVAEAMRASMTVPGVFPPIAYRDHLLVDGGIANNLPVDIGRELCGDVVIAIDVSTPIFKPGEMTSLVDFGVQAVNVSMQKSMNESLAQLRPTDLLIVPPLKGYTAADFDKAAQLIDIGEQSVLQQEERLRPYQMTPTDYEAWKSAVQLRRQRMPRLRNVVMDKTRWVNARVLQSFLDVRANQLLDTTALHQRIDSVYARGDFARISYEVLPVEDGLATLRVIPEEKPGRDFVRFGLALYSDFEGDAEFSALASLRRAWLNRLDAEWRTDVEIGRDKALYSEWYQPASLASEFFVAPHVAYRSDYREASLGGEQSLSYSLRTIDAGLEFGSVFGRWGEIRAGVQAGRGRVEQEDGSLGANNEFRRGGYSFKLTLDQLDNVRFPSGGGRVRLDALKSSHDLGADQSYSRVAVEARQAISQGSHTLLLVGRAGSSLGTQMPFYDHFRLGGLFNLSALPPGVVDSPNQLYLRGQYYRQIRQLPSLVGRGVYAGGLLEAGWGWEGERIGTPAASDLPWSAGLFLAADTFIGPFYLLGAVGQDGEAAIYMALGTNF